MVDGAEQRRRMVERQVEWRGIQNTAVLTAMREVPREHFLPGSLAPEAYCDGPLPIGGGQTISQPYIVALMAELAAIHPADRVLEVGTGSGYAAAVLGRLAAEVFTIERDARLAEAARMALASGGFANVHVRLGDGTLGWPEAQPFDAILVAAGGPSVPPTLKRQLALGGRLVMPVGPRLHQQRMVKLLRTTDGYTEHANLPVQFVPLVGAEGWSEEATR